MSTQPTELNYALFSFRTLAEVTPGASDVAQVGGKWPIAFFVPDASTDTVTAQLVNNANSVAVPVTNGWNFYEVRKITASSINSVSDANVWVAYA